MVNNGWAEPTSPAPSGPTGRTEPAATPAPGPAAEEAPVRLGRREERSPRDMVLSLAVLLIPIALLLTFYRLVLDGDKPIAVDPTPTIQEAQQAKAFTVLLPQGLGDDWHTSSATFRRAENGATLRLGYVDPDKDPIQLVQSSVPSATLLPTELTDEAKPIGTFRADNGVWRLYSGRPGEQALVLADQSRTVLVVGKTDVDNLEALAGALR